MRSSARSVLVPSSALSAAILLCVACQSGRATDLQPGPCGGAGACPGTPEETGASGSGGVETSGGGSSDGGPSNGGASTATSGDASGSGPYEDTDTPGDDRGESSSGGWGDDACGMEYTRCLEETGDLLACLPLYETCGGGNDTAGDSGSGGTDCCDDLSDACAEGEGADVCGGLEQICITADCGDLQALCPPTQIPMSRPCQSAYLACHPGFVVNNCLRIPLEACLSHVNDAAFCEARDVTCSERIAYCEDLVGFGSNYVACAEKGDVFDRCWDELGCPESAPTCSDVALFECTSGPGPLCASPLY